MILKAQSAIIQKLWATKYFQTFFLQMFCYKLEFVKFLYSFEECL